jgi:hypothetical protein
VRSQPELGQAWLGFAGRSRACLGKAAQSAALQSKVFLNKEEELAAMRRPAMQGAAGPSLASRGRPLHVKAVQSNPRCFLILNQPTRGLALRSNPRRRTPGRSNAGQGFPIQGFIFHKDNRMERISVTIEGTTPLICNKFTDAAAMKATSGSSAAGTAGEKGTPKEQAESKLYRGADGKKLVIPSPNLFRCIIDGGQFFKAGKKQVTTQKTSMIPACLAICELEVPIISKESWTVDTRAVRIPSTGGRILAHRPSFNDWQLKFEIELDTDLMTVKLLREIIDAAGKRIGLGDFRPSCKGPFGKFVVTSWVVDSKKKAA